MDLDFSVALTYLPVMLKATLLTITLALVTQTLGTSIGFVFALGRTSRSRILRFVVWAYVWLFRGTPVLLHLFFVYYAAPLFGVTLDAIPAAIIAMTLSSAAYNTEILRAGIQAVHPGQVEAAEAVGMRYSRIVRHVIAPQAVRIVIPPYMSNFISHTKNTSLASVITVPELMLTSQMVYSSTYRAIEILTVAGLIYLLLTSCLTGLQLWLERRTSYEARGMSRRRRAIFLGKAPASAPREA
ncbi:amino acid ABC transporter permease [Oceanibium sediminis]|uniref:amino acid ABC transporter permease n=1 Tax=Oceanibium sediminis TaxID=2026339 RepID=UPI000DD445C6|nr:amino acid ABC transporter permease [Oceanibium sediminis]